MTLPVIGFVGVGRIGAPMAARIRDAGYPLVVFDVDARARDAFASTAEVADSAADVADRCDVVIACLQTVAQYREAVCGERGIARGSRATTYVHVGTTGRRCVADLQAVLEARGVTVVDAPVSGGVAGARAGTLVTMTSGSRTACEAVVPIVSTYAKRCVWLGPEPGLAQAMKLVNNMLSAANLVHAAYVLTVGAKAGIPLDTMLDVVNHGTGQNSATLTKIPDNIATRRFDVGSTLANGIKDLTAFRDEAVEAGVSPALCDAILACFEEAIRQGTEGDDFATVARPFERAAGVELRGGSAT